MTGRRLTRRMMVISGPLAAGLAGMAGAGVVRAQEATTFTADSHRRGLQTVAIMINGAGPYAFALDTAANTSVIARDLAVSLGLPDAGEATMHTLLAPEPASLVRAGRLRAGALDARDVRLVMADRDGLSGVDGLLGSDLLAGLRLVFDFRGQARTSIARSRRSSGRTYGRVRLQAGAPPETAAERRFNGLLLLDAMVGDLPCKVIVDTGSTVTVINSALAREAGAERVVLEDGSDTGRVVSPTGRAADAEVRLMRGFKLGPVQFGAVPTLVGDFHTFTLWGLADQPALLMGMDLMGLFQTVTIDLGRSEVLLQP